MSAVEIIPPGRPLVGRAIPPGSKSITNRALLLAGLARGTSRLTGALKSDDTRWMAEALRAMDVIVDEPDATTFVVTGSGALRPPKQALFLGNAGTATRFLTASAAYVSEDGKSVFVSVPGLKKCDQMHLGWNIKSADGKEMQNNAYFTPYNFATFDPLKDGFGNITINMTPRGAIVNVVKPTVEEGQRLYQFIGCMGCHSVDGSVAGRLGPSWKGLYGSKRLLSDDTTVIADDPYIRESILEPSKKKAKEYLKLETGMPIYAGILSDSQIESIILYMKTLAKK